MIQRKQNDPTLKSQIRIESPFKKNELMVTKASNTLTAMSSDGIEVDKDTPRCNRGRLDTGPFCNYDCEFCYYKDVLDVKTPWEIVKGRIDHMLEYGITQIDLSGGESSVSPDWFKILDYCNERFEHVSCLSHGGKFANIDFLRESQEHGLKEILFSLHGSTAEVHDKITGRKGSFDRILKAINNAKELGIIVRLNTTVYYRNYHLLDTIHADLINSIQPLQCNFITLNYWGDYNVIEFENVDYTDMSEAIKRCVSKINSDIEIHIRYAPFCYFKGFEKYISGTYQHIYDQRDWNREMYSYALDTSKTYTEEEKLENAYAASRNQRERFYTKKLECLTCKHFYICDGVEKEVAKQTKVFPEPGEKIKQVTFYKKNKDVR